MFLQANLGGFGAIGAFDFQSQFGYQGTPTDAPATSVSEYMTRQYATPSDAGSEIIPVPGTGGQDQMTWARSLVTEDYCSRVACGVIQQSEAGSDKLRACGIAYPMQTQAWCSDACQPYLSDLHARYTFACGPTEMPPPPGPLTPAMPEMIIPPPPLVAENLPEVLRPKVTAMDPATCPSCVQSCAIQIGSCCLTDMQVLALLVIAGLAVLS